MREPDRGTVSPEEKTANLFSLDVFSLADKLAPKGNGVVIATADFSRRVQITRVQPYAKKEVGARYSAMNHMEDGDLYNHPARAIQTLIVSHDSDGVGACVRLLRAKYFDENTGNFVPSITVDGYEFKQREGDIAKFLRLNKKDRSALKYLDDSNTLYIVKEEQELNSVTPDNANEQLDKLLDTQ